MIQNPWAVCVCANPLIRCDLLTKSSVKILPESEAKILLLHAKSKIWAQKWMNSCSCRIRKSVKISLWIRNPGKNIFKICRSIRLFAPLHEGPSRTWVGVCVLLAFISWHKVHDNSWSTFHVHVVRELKCGSQSTAPTCVVWSWRLKESPRH